jgi:hypothetical protein
VHQQIHIEHTTSKHFSNDDGITKTSKLNQLGFLIRHTKINIIDAPYSCMEATCAYLQGAKVLLRQDKYKL